MKRRNFLKSTTMAGILPLLNGAAPVESEASTNFPVSPGLTKYVAEFVVNTQFEEIPADVLSLGKKSILDALGLALAGSQAAGSSLLRKYIETLGPCRREASILGTGVKSVARFAALANGSSMHSDDFDDTLIAANGLGIHPTAPVLPALLAIAESTHTSGKSLLLAYHVGVEVETKITEAIAVRTPDDAFHPTGTCGSFGSAAACAKLRAMNVEQTLNALGVAASEASGLRENFGTMTKPFHAGRAAENGIAAADLAQLGWTASPKILESSLGFFRTENDTFQPGNLLNRLGNPWSFSKPGVSIKPFPSGALTHPAMVEVLRLIKQHHFKAADIARIDVSASQSVYSTLLHHHPVTGLQGKFSLEFCLSILAIEGKAGMAQFTDDVVKRPDVQEMIQRVHFRPDSSADYRSAPLLTVITIQLKNGQPISGRASVAEGSPEHPMSVEEVTAKFRGCAEYAKWPADKTESIIKQVLRLEVLEELGSLINDLTTQ